MLPIFLGTLMVVRNLAPDPSELPADVVIAGPVGTREYVERLISDGYGSELLDLISERVRPRYVVLQDGSDETIAGYRVRAHAVVHSLGPSLAYAVSDGSGTTIGFSGDTTMCAGLRRVVALSNLMVCECTSWDAPIPSHLWQGEVSELIASHPQTKFLLSHLTERRTLPGAFIAHDLLTLDVSA